MMTVLAHDWLVTVKFQSINFRINPEDCKVPRSTSLQVIVNARGITTQAVSTAKHHSKRQKCSQFCTFYLLVRVTIWVNMNGVSPTASNRVRLFGAKWTHDFSPQKPESFIATPWFYQYDNTAKSLGTVHANGWTERTKLPVGEREG